MSKRSIFAILALAFSWIILMEDVSWRNVAIGMFVGTLSLQIMDMFFGFDEIKSINFFKLALYPFWLIGRVYIGAFSMIKLILTDAKWGIVKVRLELDDEVLRTILAESITLTPGTVYLGHKGKEIIILCAFSFS